jgi:hypothetical protein
MSQINISNFGPITSFSGQLKGVNILIGPQASGKSTITKLVYFFKMIPLWISNIELSNEVNRSLFGDLHKTIRYKFLNLFGPVSHQFNMRIQYFYDIDNSQDFHCTIYNENNLVKFQFSRHLQDLIYKFFDAIRSEYKVAQNNTQQFSGITRIRDHQTYFSRRALLDYVRKIFNNDQTPIFIPAGRTLLALLSGQVGKIPHDERDFIMGDFLETIQKIRPQFQFSLEELEQRAIATQKIQPDLERARLAREMIERVLRGRYTFENGEERIYYSQHGYTKLSYASSGQQESIWILLMTYILVLERANTFIVFEEPEAHLFPEGQDAIIRLLALLFGSSSNNQIIITTHSPYVLSATNNLIYAANIGKNNKAVHDIINKKFWISLSDMAAYSIQGEGIDIIDREVSMIKAEEIDRASQLLNSEFDRIFTYDN